MEKIKMAATKPTPPGYYSSLADFGDLFQEGIPILNYHMIAPLPARHKGIYVPPGVFSRQMRELCAAGFSSVSLTNILATTDNARRQVIISFDDGFQSVFDHAMDALADQSFKAIQFLIPKFLGKTNEWDLPLGVKQHRLMDAHQIREWLADGHEIGSHTLTHPYLTRISRKLAHEEITASRKWLEDAFGVAVGHFCYPYGDYNERVKQMVVEAGYRTACTIQFGVNTATGDPFALRRIKGRHPTRKLCSILRWLKG